MAHLARCIHTLPDPAAHVGALNLPRRVAEMTRRVLPNAHVVTNRCEIPLAGIKSTHPAAVPQEQPANRAARWFTCVNPIPRQQQI